MLKEFKLFEFMLDSRMSNCIRISNGQFVKYMSLQHLFDNLLTLHEVLGFLRYDGDNRAMYDMGLFNNPTSLVFRIGQISAMINLSKPKQRRDIWEFFMWLTGTFQPFLGQIEYWHLKMRIG